MFIIKASASSLKVTDLLFAFAFCQIYTRKTVVLARWLLAVCCLLISINKFSEVFRPAVKQRHN